MTIRCANGYFLAFLNDTSMYSYNLLDFPAYPSGKLLPYVSIPLDRMLKLCPRMPF